MREEELRLTARAASNDCDGFHGETRVQQLSAIGFDQVETHPGRLLLGGPRDADFATIREKIPGIGKIRPKKRPHLVSDRITTGANARPDRRQKPGRIGTEFCAHAGNSQLHDALHSPPPACVKCRYRAMSRIHDQHRNAVGCLYANQHPRPVRHQPVGGRNGVLCKGNVWGRQAAVGVNLTHQDQWRLPIAAEGLHKALTILDHRTAVIGFCKPQI